MKKKKVFLIIIGIMVITITLLKFLIIPYFEQKELERIKKEQIEHNKMLIKIFKENNYDYIAEETDKENGREYVSVASKFIIKSNDWWNLVEINVGELKFYEICSEDSVVDCSIYYFEDERGRYNYCRYDLKNDKPVKEDNWCKDGDSEVIKQTKQKFYEELDKLGLTEEDLVIYK